MQDDKKDFLAIVAALIAIGLGTMITAAHAENGREKNEQHIESQLEKTGWPVGSSSTR